MIRISVITFLGIAGIAWAETPRVGVSLLDGTVLEGKWVRTTGEGQFEFSSDKGIKSVSQEDVTRISIMAPSTTSMPTGGMTVEMGNGDRLVAKVVDDAGNGNGLSLNVGLPRVVAAPFASIAAIRFGEARSDFEKDFEERVRTRTAGRDVLLLVRDGKMTALPGAVDKVSETRVSFRINDKVREIAIREAYGVILGSAGGSSGATAASVVLRQGSRISGRILPGDGAAVRVDAGQLGELEIALEHVASVEFQSGRVQFLSEIKPDVRETQGIMGATWPVQIDKNLSGGAIALRGRTFGRGVCMHADARVSFKLDGAFEQFSATVGIDDSVAPAGSVIFRVQVDGRKKYESPVIHGSDDAVPISIDVRGGQTLTLEADMSDDLDISDHADWANAMLIRKK